MERETTPIDHTFWNSVIPKYQAPRLRASLWQICSSFLPFFLLWYLMVLSLDVSYFLTAALALVSSHARQRPVRTDIRRFAVAFWISHSSSRSPTLGRGHMDGRVLRERDGRFAVMRTSLVVLSLLLACSKSPSDQRAGSAAPAGSGGSSGSGDPAPSAGSSAAADPPEAAAVVGPTKSAKGVLEVSGTISGKFQWIKKDQKSPISCAWNAEKEIGGLGIDLSDGAGHLIKMTIDVAPTELGTARLDVTSANLTGPLKTKLGFNMSGDDAGSIEVKFDATLVDVAADPDADRAPAKKGAKKDDKPSGPTLTIKGTLEVTCPPKK